MNALVTYCKIDNIFIQTSVLMSHESSAFHFCLCFPCLQGHACNTILVYKKTQLLCNITAEVLHEIKPQIFNTDAQLQQPLEAMCVLDQEQSDVQSPTIPWIAQQSMIHPNPQKVYLMSNLMETLLVILHTRMMLYVLITKRYDSFGFHNVRTIRNGEIAY